MEFYKPRVDLYKRVHSAPMTMKIHVVVRVEAGKKLTKDPADDPAVGTSITYLRYKIEDDAAILKEYYASFEEEFNWDGEPHTVETYIAGGGQSEDSVNNAEPY